MAVRLGSGRKHAASGTRFVPLCRQAGLCRARDTNCVPPPCRSDRSSQLQFWGGATAKAAQRLGLRRTRPWACVRCRAARTHLVVRRPKEERRHCGITGGCEQSKVPVPVVVASEPCRTFKTMDRNDATSPYLRIRLGDSRSRQCDWCPPGDAPACLARTGADFVDGPAGVC